MTDLAVQLMHTPNDVSFELTRLTAALDRVVTELQSADDAAVRARLAYDLRYSKAFIAGDGSVDLRKHSALVDTHEHRLTAELADVRVRNLRRRVESLRIQVDTTRSIGAAIRTEIQSFGPGSVRG